MIDRLRMGRQALVGVLEFCVIFTVGVLVIDVLWGVLTRFLSKYIAISPSSWTEEVATNLLIWVSLLGAAVAYDRQAHLGVDYVVKKFDVPLQRVMAIVVQLIVVGFVTTTLIYGGYTLVTKTFATGQVTPALGLRMGYVYLAVPISGAFIALFGIQQIVELALGTREPFPSPEATTPPSATESH